MSDESLTQVVASLDYTTPTALRAALSARPYSERQKLARLVGRHARSHSPAQKLLLSLQEGDPAEEVVVEEEGDQRGDILVTVLPTTARNQGQYDLTQFAVTALVAMGVEDPTAGPAVRAEFGSASDHMARMCARELSRADAVQELVTLILAAAPRRRKALLSGCIKHRRTEVLDRVIPELKARDGLAAVSPYLHGCSSPELQRHLEGHGDELLSPDLSVRWHMVARYHPRVFVAVLLERPLRAAGDMERGGVWDRFTVWDGQWKRSPGAELLHRGGGGPLILELCQAFPVYTPRISFTKNVTMAALETAGSAAYLHHAMALPSFVTTHLAHLGGDVLWDLIVGSMRVDAHGYIRSALQSFDPIGITPKSTSGLTRRVFQRAIELVNEHRHTNSKVKDLFSIVTNVFTRDQNVSKLQYHQTDCLCNRSLWQMTAQEPWLRNLYMNDLESLVVGINPPQIAPLLDSIFSHFATSGPECSNPDVPLSPSPAPRVPSCECLLTYEEKESDGFTYRIHVDLLALDTSSWANAGEVRHLVGTHSHVCTPVWVRQNLELYKRVRSVAQKLSVEACKKATQAQKSTLASQAQHRLRGLVQPLLKWRPHHLCQAWERIEQEYVQDQQALAEFYSEVLLACCAINGVEVPMEVHPRASEVTKSCPGKHGRLVVQQLSLDLARTVVTPQSMLAAWRSLAPRHVTGSSSGEKRTPTVTEALQHLLQVIRTRTKALTDSFMAQWKHHLSLWLDHLEFIVTIAGQEGLLDETAASVRGWAERSLGATTPQSVTNAVKLEDYVTAHAIFRGERVSYPNSLVSGADSESLSVYSTLAQTLSPSSVIRCIVPGSLHNGVTKNFILASLRRCAIEKEFFTQGNKAECGKTFLTGICSTIEAPLRCAKLLERCRVPRQPTGLPQNTVVPASLIPLGNGPFLQQVAGWANGLVASLTLSAPIWALTVSSEKTQQISPLSVVSLVCQWALQLHPAVSKVPNLQLALDASVNLLSSTLKDMQEHSTRYRLEDQTTFAMEAVDLLAKLTKPATPGRSTHFLWCQGECGTKCADRMQSITEVLCATGTGSVVKIVKQRQGELLEARRVAEESSELYREACAHPAPEPQPVSEQGPPSARELRMDQLVKSLSSIDGMGVKKREKILLAIRNTLETSPPLPVKLRDIFHTAVRRLEERTKACGAQLFKTIAQVPDLMNSLLRLMAHTGVQSSPATLALLWDLTEGVVDAVRLPELATTASGVNSLWKHAGSLLTCVLQSPWVQFLPTGRDHETYVKIFDEWLSCAGTTAARVHLIPLVPSPEYLPRITETFAPSAVIPLLTAIPGEWAPLQHRAACWAACVDAAFAAVARVDPESEGYGKDPSSSEKQTQAWREKLVLRVVPHVMSAPTASALHTVVAHLVPASIHFLATQQPSQLVALLGNVYRWRGDGERMEETCAVCAEAVANLLYPQPGQAHLLSADYRNQLLEFQDVQDHRIRKSLTRLADSNSATQRLSAIHTLLRATANTSGTARAIQCERTLGFVVVKIRNEAGERRASVVGDIVRTLGPDCVQVSEKCAGLMADIVGDALESPDIDAPDSMDFFVSIRRLCEECVGQAVHVGPKTEAGVRLVKFAVETTHAIELYSLGEEKCRQTFSPVSSEFKAQFVEHPPLGSTSECSVECGRDLLDVLGSLYTRLVPNPSPSTEQQPDQQQNGVDWSRDVPLRAVRSIGAAFRGTISHCPALLTLLQARLAAIEQSATDLSDASSVTVSLTLAVGDDVPVTDVLTYDEDGGVFRGSVYALVAASNPEGGMEWSVMRGAFDRIAHSSSDVPDPWLVREWVACGERPTHITVAATRSESHWLSDEMRDIGAEAAEVSRWLLESCKDGMWWNWDAMVPVTRAATALIRSLRLSGTVYRPVSRDKTAMSGMVDLIGDMVEQLLSDRDQILAQWNAQGAVYDLLCETLELVAETPRHSVDIPTVTLAIKECDMPEKDAHRLAVRVAQRWHRLCLPVLKSPKSLRETEQAAPYFLPFLCALERGAMADDVCEAWYNKKSSRTIVLPRMLSKYVLAAAAQKLVWWEWAPLAGFTRNLLTRLTTFFHRDVHGMLVVEAPHSPSVHTLFPVRFFLTLVHMHGHEWTKTPLCVEFVDVMLHSRQLGTVILPWLTAHTSQQPSRYARHLARVECVQKLLAITSSAIFLPLVHRTLMRSAQHLLLPYCDPTEPHLGPFFPDPDGPVGGTPDPFAKPMSWEREQQLSSTKLSHFCLPVSHGLRRLSPEQCVALTCRWERLAADKDTPMALRARTLAHRTLLPNTTLHAIVQLCGTLEDNIKLLETAMRGVMRLDALGPSLHYLLRPSILSTDRARVLPGALLQCAPRMLASDLNTLFVAILSPFRRRCLKITAHKAVVRLVASQPSNPAMVRIVEQELAHPEIHRDVKIAVLECMLQWLCLPSEVELATNTAWRALEEVSGTIPTTTSGAEALVALLGAQPPSFSAMHTSSSNVWVIPEATASLTIRDGAFEHMKAFGEVVIPRHHAARYAKTVICRLADMALEEEGCKEESHVECAANTPPSQEAVGQAELMAAAKLQDIRDACDDVRALATSVVGLWAELDLSSCLATLERAVSTTARALLYDVRPDVLEVRRARWSHSMQSLVAVACRTDTTTTTTTTSQAPCDAIARAVSALWDHYQAIDTAVTPGDVAESTCIDQLFGVRRQLAWRLTHFLDQLSGRALSLDLVSALPHTHTALIGKHVIACYQRMCSDPTHISKRLLRDTVDMTLNYGVDVPSASLTAVEEAVAVISKHNDMLNSELSRLIRHACGLSTQFSLYQMPTASTQGPSDPLSALCSEVVVRMLTANHLYVRDHPKEVACFISYRALRCAARHEDIAVLARILLVSTGTAALGKMVQLCLQSGGVAGWEALRKELLAALPATVLLLKAAPYEVGSLVRAELGTTVQTLRVTAQRLRTIVKTLCTDHRNDKGREKHLKAVVTSVVIEVLDLDSVDPLSPARTHGAPLSPHLKGVFAEEILQLEESVVWAIVGEVCDAVWWRPLDILLHAPYTSQAGHPLPPDSDLIPLAHESRARVLMHVIAAVDRHAAGYTSACTVERLLDRASASPAWPVWAIHIVSHSLDCLLKHASPELVASTLTTAIETPSLTLRPAQRLRHIARAAQRRYSHCPSREAAMTVVRDQVKHMVDSALSDAGQIVHLTDLMSTEDGVRLVDAYLPSHTVMQCIEVVALSPPVPSAFGKQNQADNIVRLIQMSDRSAKIPKISALFARLVASHIVWREHERPIFLTALANLMVSDPETVLRALTTEQLHEVLAWLRDSPSPSGSHTPTPSEFALKAASVVYPKSSLSVQPKLGRSVISSCEQFVTSSCEALLADPSPESPYQAMLTLLKTHTALIIACCPHLLSPLIDMMIVSTTLPATEKELILQSCFTGLNECDRTRRIHAGEPPCSPPLCPAAIGLATAFLTGSLRRSRNDVAKLLSGPSTVDSESDASSSTVHDLTGFAEFIEDLQQAEGMEAAEVGDKSVRSQTIAEDPDEEEDVGAGEDIDMDSEATGEESEEKEDDSWMCRSRADLGLWLIKKYPILLCMDGVVSACQTFSRALFALSLDDPLHMGDSPHHLAQSIASACQMSTEPNDRRFQICQWVRFLCLSHDTATIAHTVAIELVCGAKEIAGEESGAFMLQLYAVMDRAACDSEVQLKLLLSQ